MKSFKLLLSVIALVAFAAAPVLRAEEGDAPAPKPKKEMQSPIDRILAMKEKLNLTDDQVAQIKKIGEGTREEMKALRGKEGTPESKKEDFKKIAEAAKAKIDAVLTPEQKATLDAMKKKHGKGLGGEKGPKDDKKGPPPVES